MGLTSVWGFVLSTRGSLGKALSREESIWEWVRECSCSARTRRVEGRDRGPGLGKEPGLRGCSSGPEELRKRGLGWLRRCGGEVGTQEYACGGCIRPWVKYAWNTGGH